MIGLERYVGQVLDEKYRLERLLGQGGMGAVYLATHLGTERYVALKLITPQFMRNEEFVERFKREARAAGRLRHPNVVDVTDFGFALVGPERVAYLVMEYLDGCTLGDVLAEEKRLPLEWVVDILEQVCSAVQEAHQQGIVHRDLKPDNIWLEPNRLGSYRVKVLDFGIAKLGQAGTPVTDSIATAPTASASITGSSEGRATRRTSLSVGSDAATLIYPSGEGEEAATQRLLASEPQVEDAVVADVAAEIGTQMFSSPATEIGQLTQMGRSARETQAGVDGDRTLMFDQSATVHGAMEAQPIMPGATIPGAGLTRVGAIMGTPLYMSPEQCRSAHLDARSDIYSLGVIAYQMLAGDLPFTGNTAAVLSGHLETAPTHLRQRTRKVPRGVARTVMSALAKNPAERPQSALALANSLRAQSDGIGSMYRRAFALYSEYFPKFLRMSLIAHIPVIFFTLCTVALTIGEQSLSSHGKALKILTLCTIAIVSLLQIVSFVLAANAISGMTAIIVTQLSVAPLRPVQLRTVFAVLKQRWRPFLNTSIRLAIRIMIGYVLLIIPGIVMSVRYSLWGPVVLMEGLSKKAALKRARELASRSWKTVIIVSVLQLVIPMAVSAAIGRFSFKVEKQSTPQAQHSVNVSRSVSQQLSGLINILIVPLMSIVPALLYLKMRQMGGEPLTAALEQIEEVESQHSQWQKRMRSRLTVTPMTASHSSRSNSQQTPGTTH
jgi:serine/threonine protein kinase